MRCSLFALTAVVILFGCSVQTPAPPNATGNNRAEDGQRDHKQEGGKPHDEATVVKISSNVAAWSYATTINRVSR
jgi:hypothetical protein